MDLIDVLSVVDDTSLGQDVRSTMSGQEQAATDAVEDVVSEAETYGVKNRPAHRTRRTHRDNP